jgi:hypothetical protein
MYGRVHQMKKIVTVYINTQHVTQDYCTFLKIILALTVTTHL